MGSALKKSPRELVSELWKRHYSDYEPVPYWLRTQMQWLWLRVHHLPNGRRYPRTTDELNAALAAHEYVMRHIFSGGPLLAVFAHHEHEFDPAQNGIVGVQQVEYWRCVSVRERELHLFVGAIECEMDIRALLVSVIEDRVPPVFLCQPPSSVLYQPYDGGMDVIATSVDQRNQWRALLGGET